VESQFAAAAEKTTAILQELQLRLGREPAVSPAAEAADDLAHQLQEYFGVPGPPPPADAAIPEAIREGVINGVVDRILQAWADPQGKLSKAFKNEVLDRVAQRVLERLK